MPELAFPIVLFPVVSDCNSKIRECSKKVNGIWFTCFYIFKKCISLLYQPSVNLRIFFAKEYARDVCIYKYSYHDKSILNIPPQRVSNILDPFACVKYYPK